MLLNEVVDLGPGWSGLVDNFLIHFLRQQDEDGDCMLHRSAHKFRETEPVILNLVHPLLRDPHRYPGAFPLHEHLLLFQHRFR